MVGQKGMDMKDPVTFEQAVRQAVNHVNNIAKLTGEDGLNEAERYLTACGFDTHGIEYVNVDGGVGLAYLNTGDTYTLTVAYEGENGEMIATSWGDWFEENEDEVQTDT